MSSQQKQTVTQIQISTNITTAVTQLNISQSSNVAALYTAPPTGFIKGTESLGPVKVLWDGTDYNAYQDLYYIILVP